MAPLPPPPPPSNGLLSNVFNFVSRELESFVANATGGESSQVPISQPETSDSRVKVTRSKRTKHNDGNSRVHETSRPEDKPPLPRVSTRREPLSQSLKCLHEPQNYHQPSKRTSRRSLNESKSSSPARDSRCNGSHKGSGGESLASTVTASDHVPDHNENSRPCTPPRNLKRQKSFTMPGALFPMSPSVEPESPPLSPTLEGEDRQVHFTPSPSHPAPKRSRSSGVTLLEEHGESVTSSPSYRRSKHRKTMDGRSRSSERMPPPSPAFRPSAIASVQDAIRKFQPGPDEAGPSILLPNSPSPSSPTKPRDKGRETTGTNGANKTIDPEVEEILASSSSRSSKGKGKEREDPRRYGFEGPDSSGVLRIWGKERELSVAIEEQRRKEREWTLEPESDRDRGRIEGERRRDKERIRHLEEEVRRLKDELARRPVVNPSTDFRNPLPPPPPPAPPIGIAPRAPADTSAATDAILMAARASLRHAGTPKEAPINAGPMAARTRRTGQPTVNVPSEKMAAFLNEMKTVRLRKVSSGESAAPRPPSSMGENAALSKSFSVDSRPRDRAFELAVERGSVSMDAAASTRTWLDELVKTGQKRKRNDQTLADEHGDVLRAAVKRRYNANNSSESTASTSTTSSKSSLRFGTSQESQSTSRTSASEHDNSPVFAEPYPLLAKPVLSTSVPRRPAITVPSVTDAIDLTTPSLSSDHDEVSNEDETSQEDKLPHTPPTHTMDLPESPQSTASSPLKGVPAFAPPKTADFYIEPIRDTTSRRPRYLTPPPRVRDQTPSPSYSPILVAFPKRLPSSPLPAASPRRPKPPGRIPGKALRPSRTQTRNSGNLDDLDNDPLSLSSKSVDVEASNGIRSRPVIRPLNVRDKLTRSRSASRVNTASDRSETRHFTRDKNVSQNPRTDTNEASTSRRYAGEASNSRGDRSDFRNSKRDTLHDELRRANASLPLSLEPQPDLFESEVYLGVGTKSKHRGFLAGGGAGGVPVFMGEGYVDGVEVEWEGEVRVIPGLEVEHEGQKQITEHEVQLRQPAQRTVGKKGSGIPRRQRAQ